MRMSSRLVLEGGVLALLLATAGCTKPSSDNGTGGSSGTATGGSTGTGGSSTTGTGGSSTTGTGGSSTTGTGGSSTTGTGGSSTTGTGGSSTTGTGGSTTGTGGTTGGGTGGAGGAVVQKDCATKTKLTNPAFMNFENYDGTVTADKYATAFGGATVNTGTAYAGVYSFGDGTATPTLSMMAGHPTSNWAASQSVTQATAWGMGGGVWMGCADASTYKGISFWVRGSSGTGMFSFNINMESTTLPDATNPAGGGTCPGTTDTCKGPSKANIPLTTDWTQVQILWSDFTAGTSGTTSVVPDGNNITGLVWNVPLAFHLDPTVPADAAGPYIAIAGNLLINVDDISFIQ
jgi:hypothetical protein